MIKVCASHDRMLIESLKARLATEQIEHLVKDESSSSLGEVPPIVSCQYVWVIHEDDVARARVIVQELESQSEVSNQEPWTCASCGEVLEAQFTSCWKCGADRANG